MANESERESQYLGVSWQLDRQVRLSTPPRPPFVAGDLFRRRRDKKSQLGHGGMERERLGMDLAIAVSDLARSSRCKKSK